MYSKPNTTPTPDEFFTKGLRELTGAEAKVTAFAAFKTYGYGKQWDWISTSQIIEFCGLSKQGALNAADGAVAKGHLVRKFRCGHCLTEIIGEKAEAREKTGEKVEERERVEEIRGKANKPCGVCGKPISLRSFYALNIDNAFKAHIESIVKREGFESFEQASSNLTENHLHLSSQLTPPVKSVDPPVNSGDPQETIYRKQREKDNIVESTSSALPGPGDQGLKSFPLEKGQGAPEKIQQSGAEAVDFAQGNNGVESTTVITHEADGHRPPSSNSSGPETRPDNLPEQTVGKADATVANNLLPVENNKPSDIVNNVKKTTAALPLPAAAPSLKPVPSESPSVRPKLSDISEKAFSTLLDFVSFGDEKAGKEFIFKFAMAMESDHLSLFRQTTDKERPTKGGGTEFWREMARAYPTELLRVIDECSEIDISRVSQKGRGRYLLKCVANKLVEHVSELSMSERESQRAESPKLIQQIMGAEDAQKQAEIEKRKKDRMLGDGLATLSPEERLEIKSYGSIDGFARWIGKFQVIASKGKSPADAAREATDYILPILRQEVEDKAKYLAQREILPPSVTQQPATTVPVVRGNTKIAKNDPLGFLQETYRRGIISADEYQREVAKIEERKNV